MLNLFRVQEPGDLWYSHEQFERFGIKKEQGFLWSPAKGFQIGQMRREIPRIIQMPYDALVNFDMCIWGIVNWDLPYGSKVHQLTPDGDQFRWFNVRYHWKCELSEAKEGISNILCPARSPEEARSFAPEVEVLSIIEAEYNFEFFRNETHASTTE